MSLYAFSLNDRYPAGHIYVHRVLHALTNSGTNLAAAQQIFAVLYQLSLALTCAIYTQAGSIPNWALLLLPLSKRLHSIYVLRLFNDCWSVVAAQAAILAFSGGHDTLGVLLYRCARYAEMFFREPNANHTAPQYLSRCQRCSTCLEFSSCSSSVLALSQLPGTSWS